MKKLAYILFMLILSFAPFLWHDLRVHRFLGSGDFLSIDAASYTQAVFFVFDQKSWGGANLAFLGAHFMPFYVFFRVLSLLQLTPMVIALSFLSFILFVSQLSAHFFLMYVLKSKIGFLKFNEALATFGAILYGFSPYIVGLISPGHILLLVAYAFYPLILKAYDQFITDKKINLHRLYILFILFFLCATSFANVGSPTAIFITLFVYSLLSSIFVRIPIGRLLLRFVLTGVTAFMSNAWWMAPYLFSIRTTVAINEASGGIQSHFGNAAVKATIANILFGKAEFLMYIVLEFKKYIQIPTKVMFALFIVLFSFAILSLRKHKYFLIILGMVLFGIYITKTDQLPFFEPYKLIYENVRGFQIFRRPVSKFYWVPLFYYTVAITAGFGVLVQKMKRRGAGLLMIFMILIASYFAVLFAKTPLLTPFTIPDYYYDAAGILSKEKAERILMLPSTYGFQPAFNQTVNWYYGTDFLWFIWPYSIIYPDSSLYSPALPFKPLAASLMASIRNGESFCEKAKALNVSHIVVRRDLSPGANVEDAPELLLRQLEQSKDTASIASYGTKDDDGITLFTVAPSCRGSLIHFEGGNASVQYQIKSPVWIEIQITNLASSGKLQYLSNFTKFWHLFPSGNWSSMISIPFQKSPFYGTQHPVYTYANEWDISPEFVRSHFRSNEYTVNPDGSVNIKLSLYYLPQLVAYAGWIITGTFFIGGLLLCLKNKK